MSTPMIKLNHMSHTYEDENGQTVYALNDISLEIQTGEFVDIIGKNGIDTGQAFQRPSRTDRGDV